MRILFSSSSLIEHQYSLSISKGIEAHKIIDVPLTPYTVEKRKGLRFLVNPRFYWSGRGDLNSGPPEPHSGALPGCATSRKNAIIVLPLCFVKE